MGCCQVKRSGVNVPIGVDFRCPRCGQVFSAATTNRIVHQLNFHLDRCLQNSSVSSHQIQQTQKFNFSQYFESIPKNPQHYWEKVIDQNSTQGAYKWVKKQFSRIDADKVLTIQQCDIQIHNFVEKQAWFRGKLELLRIPWQVMYNCNVFVQEGCTLIQISQEDIIQSSIKELRHIPSPKSNLRGEIKIHFIQDAIVLDAGGLLREWSAMIIQEMIQQKMLLRADTEEFTYKFSSHSQSDLKANAFELLGLVFGKAIFEKIPLNCYLDRTIIKQILEKEIILSDIVYYDKQLYKSWQFLSKDDNTIGELMLTFTIEVNNKGIELKDGGENIIVTNENKEEYIKRWYTIKIISLYSIQYYTHDSLEPYLQIFLKSLYHVVPKEYLKAFAPEELEMILFGLPIISLEDWRNNTSYKGEYHDYDEQIIWFWEILQSQSQEELARFLQFCTGSSRIPVEGFRLFNNKLESNRGVISPFCIESSEYDCKNPYPRAHTCFNRLDLPKYESKELMETYIKATLNSILLGQFGLE